MEGEARPQESTPQKSGGAGGTITGIIVIVVILAAAGFFYERHAQQKSDQPAMTQATPVKKVSMQQSASPAASKVMFKDGTYTAEGDYITHVGQKHIKVTITLKNDMITTADVVNEADDQMSDRYQDSFISGYKPMVIGKEISSVHLGKVALSSLTPNGFNSALQTIEKQAKS